MEGTENKISELNEQIKSLNAELLERERAVTDKSMEIRAVYTQLIEQYNAKHADFIGKNVRVSWTKSYEKSPKVIQGFLEGFVQENRYSSPRSIRIVPVLRKIKQDGTSSKVMYPTYDMPDAASIESIEEVK